MSMRWVLGLMAASGCLAASSDVAGRVVDEATGAPVAHVRITFHSAGQPQGSEVSLLSDTDGTFRITNLPVGGYQVSCEKPGYLSLGQWFNAAEPPDGKPAPLVLRLTAQAALEGTVVDDRDAPIENVFIQLVRQMVVNGRRTIQNSQGGNTDETGSFRLFNLNAGRYYVHISATLRGARSKNRAYPELFYPTALDIDAAQPVDLKPGDEIQIRIKLPEPIPAHEIRGVIVTDSPNVGISLIRQPAVQNFLRPSGQVNWDTKTRSFRIAHVTAGVYQMLVNVYDGKGPRVATTTVTMGDEDVAGIRLEPVESVLDGTVRIEGNSTPLVPTFVSLQSARGGAGGPIDSNGKFHIIGLMPDTYRVQPGTFGGLCIASVLQGGRDVRDELVVTADTPPAPLEITLSSHCGDIAGTLSLSDSNPPPHLMALLMRQSGGELVVVAQTPVKASGPNAGPQFRFQRVAPGDYMVFVWPQEANLEYANPDFLREFGNYGTAVSVGADGKASVNVERVLTPPVQN